MENLIPFLSAWVLLGVIGYFIGRTKDRGGDGAALGMLIGPLGWIIVLLLPDKKQEPIKGRKRPIVLQAEDPLTKWERKRQEEEQTRWLDRPGSGTLAGAVPTPLLSGMNQTEEARLLRLKGLLDKSLITTEEYAAKRSEILESM